MRRNGCGVGIVLAVLLILWHNHSKFQSMKMREREERMCPQKIALLTDSCADLTPALIRQNHIHVVPLRILCADGEYRDIAHPINSTTRERIQQLVLEKYREAEAAEEQGL